MRRLGSSWRCCDPHGLPLQNIHLGRTWTDRTGRARMSYIQFWRLSAHIRSTIRARARKAHIRAPPGPICDIQSRCIYPSTKMQKVGSPKSVCGPPKRVFWRFLDQLWSVDLEAARTQYTIYKWCRIWRFGQEKAIYNIRLTIFVSILIYSSSEPCRSWMDDQLILVDPWLISPGPGLCRFTGHHSGHTSKALDQGLRHFPVSMIK